MAHPDSPSSTPSDPWRRTASSIGHIGRHVRIHIDDVVRPDGSTGEYDWVETSDLVRVAAVVADEILLIEQHHYLIGRTLQLPGGQIESGESDEDAGRRELCEETGFSDGVWQRFGFVYPLPGLSPVKVHLWQAHDLVAGIAHPEPYEGDLEVRRMSLTEAAAAVRTGLVRCAASATLILAAVSA